MPTLPINDQNVARATDVLRAGRPVVLPLPTPMAYVVIGTDAAAVNMAKQRPASQSAGLSLASLDLIAPHLDLADDAPIITGFGHLYMSSANLTSEPPATTAAEASRSFGGQLVLDGDTLRDQSVPHGSTTIVRMSRTGDLTVARSGINNRSFGDDLTGYTDDLTQRWRAAHADR